MGYLRPGSTAVIDRDPTARHGTGSMDTMGEHDYYEPVVTDRVYFLLDPEACQIKIGTTGNLEQRIKDHEQRRGHKLELLGTMAGGYRLERAMHNRFSEHRQEREWFDSCIAVDVLGLLS